MRPSLAALAFVVATLVPLAGLNAQGGAAETVSVELSSFKFAPATLTFQRGHLYRLHLVNTAGGGHDFNAPEFFAASMIAPGDQGKVAGGRVRLKGKQTVDITLTPEKAGAYALTCSHFMHSTFGMTGRIVVR